MIHFLSDKLAELAVKYSLGVKEGDRVSIKGHTLSKDLLLSIYSEVLKAGAYPLLRLKLEGTDELKFRYSNEKQLQYEDDILLKIVEEFDCIISIFDDYNTKKLSTVQPELIRKFQSSEKRIKINQIFNERAAKKELRWVIVPYPCHSHAQEAAMDLFTYTDFVNKALLLDKEKPVAEWTKIMLDQEKICRYLNNVEKIQIIGEDTDLTFSVKGRSWLNSCGKLNLPDGEVATSPIENSASGSIRFTYPGIYIGREVENLYFEFKDGKVVYYSADKGEDLIEQILSVKNANNLGEFAIGTNYGIKKFTKNMLFDEKMGGTIHCALGMALQETGSKHNSNIHWDILKNMKTPDSKIIGDGIVIYQAGKWLI
jgi:aminopeptidase